MCWHSLQHEQGESFSLNGWTSRSGGGGEDVGKGPLWPPAVVACEHRSDTFPTGGHKGPFPTPYRCRPYALISPLRLMPIGRVSWLSCTLRTFSVNARIFPVSFTLFVSTPLLTSTPHGQTCVIASATFSEVSPPASRIGSSSAMLRASCQLCVSPVPPQEGVGVSRRMRHTVSRYASILPLSSSLRKCTALSTGCRIDAQNSGDSV